jgi:Type VI secretion system/phage-baseplate injector OB domain
MSLHFGIYRATVVNRSDPQNKRRLQVIVPDVLGLVVVWANACVAPGSRVQPMEGTSVWVQFEGGDLQRPVWVGVKP